jgi:Uma2 family endonuclease
MASAIEREATTRRWRRVEYERLVDLGVFTGERLELIDGVLVVREPQGSYHAAITTKIGRLLASAFGDNWHTRLHSPLALGEHSEPEPDIAVVAGQPEDYLEAHPATAALVVEVAEASLRLDRRFKTALYAAAGLPEYWIANLVDRTLEIHRDPQPPPDRTASWSYRSIEVLRPPAVVTPQAAPAARIAIVDLLP